MRDRSIAIAMYMMLSKLLFCSLGLVGKQPDEAILVEDNSAFAIDLYQKLRASGGNVFFSPYSISAALAMTYAGARGNTQAEMARTLRFSLGQKALHAGFANIEARLNELQRAGNIKLSVANSLWPQQDYVFLDEYLSLVEKYYGVSITPVDYRGALEDAGMMIDKWVEDKTQGKIKDLIPPGVLDALTRLVLVNAIYFKGDWESQFKPELTKEAPFHVTSEESVVAAMMTQQQEFSYAEFETLQVLELPYVGEGLSMIVLLPQTTGGLELLENTLTVENLERWMRRLVKREVLIFMPKFKLTSTFRLDKTLEAMGMLDAFSASKANFAGMDGRPDWLYIGAALHKAFVEVNEEGTEAAAATAVVMKARGMPTPIPTFHANHPFIFLIRENRTGGILFIGRVIDPTKIGEDEN